jgi:hypothetical protein
MIKSAQGQLILNGANGAGANFAQAEFAPAPKSVIQISLKLFSTKLT